MQLLKTDFLRFFAIGFGAGALVVFGVIGTDDRGELAHGMVPSAVAAPTTE